MRLDEDAQVPTESNQPRSNGGRPAQRATLKTISDLTGLSLSTVSLALRGGARLKPETHKRVTEAAAELGYVPDRAGVRLRTGKTNVIALALQHAGETIDFARYLIQGIGHAVEGTRYHLNVTPDFKHDDSLGSIRHILENRLADGLIVTHTSARDPRVQLMMDYDYPFVTHGRTEFYTPHAYHDFDSERFVRLALERMAGLGRRRIMLVVGSEATYNFHLIAMAYRRIASEMNLDARLASETVAGGTPEQMRAYGIHLASSADRPDGIICDSELRSLCIIAGLEEAGITTGPDIHFICKQTAGLLPALHPTIDTIEEDVLAAGAELTRLLLARIEGKPPQTLQTLGDPIVHWRN
jgi:LacI family transcriptional regulator